MPVFNPFVIIGTTDDGVKHLINVQTADVSPLKMFIRMLCYRHRPAFYKRYSLGITMTKLNKL